MAATLSAFSVYPVWLLTAAIREGFHRGSCGKASYHYSYSTYHYSYRFNNNFNFEEIINF